MLVGAVGNLGPTIFISPPQCLGLREENLPVPADHTRAHLFRHQVTSQQGGYSSCLTLKTSAGTQCSQGLSWNPCPLLLLCRCPQYPMHWWGTQCPNDRESGRGPRCYL